MRRMGNLNERGRQSQQGQVLARFASEAVQADLQQAKASLMEAEGERE